MKKFLQLRFVPALAASCLVAVAMAAPAPAPAASLLDHLPRAAKGQYAATLAAARARGAAGRADVLWLELFYGDPAAKQTAQKELASPQLTVPAAQAPELAFTRFVAAYSRGSDRAMLEAALQLTRTAPNDVATELAVRALSGQLENQGRALLDAVPSLQHVLEQPLADPTTTYMLGRSLLAAVHAPGLALTQEVALRLSGRLAHWELWGPFGQYQNLGFDQSFPIETSVAADYPSDLGPGASDAATRRAQPFTSSGDGVHFPLDWGAQGVDFAVTWVQAPAPTRALLRLYTPASAQIAVNGTVVLRNDRRSSYTTAATAGAVELAAGWNRIVVKLAGEASRNFDLMLRPLDPNVRLVNAATLPSGASAGAAARRLPAPPTLAEWGAARRRQHADDAVALWVSGLRMLQDEDAEGAREALLQAGKLAPQAAPVWLDLSEADGNLSDASQSWAAAQVELAAHQALTAAPGALRAFDRLGHVYESQGKVTQAAEQFARCANQGFGDCDWSSFHLAAGQHWRPEAESALEHALADSGSDWQAITSGLEFYSAMGDEARLRQWEQVLRADPRAAGALGQYDLRHGRAEEAATLLHTAIGFAPSSAELHREWIEALLESGDVAQAAQVASAATQAFPGDWRIAEAAAQVALRQGPQAGLTALRQHQFNRNLLRHQADFLQGERFWAPWYHSSAQIIADAPGKSEYPNASAILVFDQMVNRVNPDSTQDQYIHQIYRVLNAAGISQFGDVTTIAPGSDLLTLRTIKQDGRMLLPENLSNLSDVTMPGLEAGDYIEIEFVQHVGVSRVIPATLDNSSFFIFNSSTEPYHYSDYIALTPPHYPLLLDQERFPSQPVVRTMPDGYTAREWLVQKTRILVTEPNMPPEQTLVPKVWISSPQTWEQISRYYADHTYAVRRTTREMQTEAATLTAGKSSDVAKADAIFAWVAANIQPGQGSILTPARQYFTDRNGNRIATFLGLLSAARVPFQLVMARESTDDSSIKTPSVFQFQYPLVHVAATAADTAPAAGWYDLTGDFAKLGYVGASVRGGLALAVAADIPGGSGGEFTHVPDYNSPYDGLSVAVTGTVGETGDATLHVKMEFHGPAGEQVRTELANLPAASLPQVYQQILLASYPSATASGGNIENRTAKGEPLIFDIDATVPDFVHSSGTGSGATWDIERLTGSVGVLNRYAPLATRTEPLLIPGESFEQTQLTLTLPAKFGAATLPAPAQLDNRYGTFSSSFSQHGNQIVFQRRLLLKANRVQPNQYSDFRSFAEAVDTQDRLEITGHVTSAPRP